MRRLLAITATLAAVVTVAFSGTAWKWGAVVVHRPFFHRATLADTDGWTWDGSTTLNVPNGWTWDGGAALDTGA